ncbi:MAG: hypothetical protein WCP15_01355 [bacterium]
MSSWSNRRKLIYLFFFFLIVVIFALGIWYLFFYKAPTCFDGIQNQNEEWVDCGGICSKICQNRFIIAKIDWVKFDYVAPGLYNVGAYIRNENLAGYVPKANYVFRLYDKDGVVITERFGSMYIPPHKNTLAFERGIDTGKRIPTRVMFDFVPSEDTELLDWRKYTGKEIQIFSKNIDLTNEDTSPSLTADLQNDSLDTYRNVDVYAILYDIDKNVLGFSKTKIDEIAPGSTEEAVFTWVKARGASINSKEIIPVVLQNI